MLGGTLTAKSVPVTQAMRFPLPSPGCRVLHHSAEKRGESADQSFPRSVLFPGTFVLHSLADKAETTKTRCKEGRLEPNSLRAAQEAVSWLKPLPERLWGCRPPALPASALATPVAGEACGDGGRWRGAGARSQRGPRSPPRGGL